MINYKDTVRESCLWLCMHSGATAWYQRRARAKAPLVRVLCLHDVPDHAWFAELLALLYTQPYNLLTPDDFHAGQFHPERINILLTFDDGFASWTEVAAPILAERDARALFFITSGLLDRATDTTASAQFMRQQLRLQNPRPPLTWAGARTLLAAGHTIGGHSASHADLTTLDLPALEADIRSDRERIKSELDIAPHDFAYTFGTKRHYNDEVAREVAEQKYRYIYTAEPGWYRPAQPDCIPRTLLNSGQSLTQLPAWLHGSYDIFRRVTSS